MNPIIDKAANEMYLYSKKKLPQQEYEARRKMARGRSLVIKLAMDVLRRVVTREARVRIPTTMADMERWIVLEQDKKLSFLQCFRDVDGVKSGLLVHLRDASLHKILKKLAPAFFVDFPRKLEARSHVYILDGRIATQACCMLVLFYKPPSGAQVDVALRHLCEMLGVDNDEKKRYVTKPFALHPNNLPLTIGGNVARQALKDILSPAMRKVIGNRQSRAEKGTPSTAVAKMTYRYNSDNKGQAPRSIVIWCRQSRAEGSARTSIPTQLWTALTSEAPPLMSLREGDDIKVVIEYCSSAATGWSDRAIGDDLPYDRDWRLITVNPDRFTRRAEELGDYWPTLATEDKNNWFSQAVNAEKPAEWHRVQDHRASVEDRLRLGKCLLPA